MVKRRRAFAATGAFIILFLAATPLVYRAVSRKAGSIVVDLQTYVKKELGLDLRFSSISPSILSSLTLNGIRFSRPDGSVLLSAGRLSVLYSLPALVAGDSRHIVKDIRLDKTRLSLVLPGDADTAEKLRKLLGSGPASTPPPISIRLTDTVMELRDTGSTSGGTSGANAGGTAGGGSYRLDSALITFSTKEAVPALSFLNGNYSLSPAGNGFSVSGPLEFGLSFNPILSSFRGKILIGYRAEGFSVSGQSFNISFDGSRFELDRPASEGLAARAVLNLQDKNLSASVDLKNFVPAKISAVVTKSANTQALLDDSYTGNIRVRVPGLEGRRAEYAVDIGSEGEGEGAGGASPVGAASGSAEGGAGVSGESNRVTGLRVKGEGRGQAVKIEEARLEYGVVSGSFAGEVGLEGLTVDGLLGLELKGKGGEKGGQTELAVKGGKGEYRLAGATLRVGDEEYAQPEIEAKVGSKVVELKGGLGRGKEGKGREVSVQVRLDRTGELRAEGEVDLEGYRLGSVGVVYGAVTGKTEDLRVLRGLRATGRVYATSDFRKVSWNAPGMKVSGGEGFSLGCAGVGNGDYAEVKNVKIEAGGKEVEGEGRVDFEAGGDLRFRVKAKYEGIEYGIEGKAKADGSVEAKGDYGIEVEVQREAGGGYAVGFGVGGVPVPMGKGMGVVNVMARGKGEYRSGKEWRVEGVEFSVAGAGGKESPIPKIRGSLKGKAGEVELAEVVVEGWGRKLKGPVSIRYGEEVKGGVEVKGRLEREGGEGERGRWGQESWSVDAGYRDGSLKGSIDLKGFPIRRLYSDAPEAEADGYLSFEGPFDFARLGDPAGPGTIKARLMAGLRSPSFDVAERRFDISFDGKKIEAHLPDRDGISIAATYAPAGKDLVAGLSLRDFRLSDFVDLKTASKDFSAFFGMPLTGKLELKVPAGDFGKAAFTAKLEGQSGTSFLSVPAETGVVEATGGGTGLSLALDADGTAANMQVRKLSFSRGADRVEFAGRIGLADMSVDGSALIAIGAQKPGGFPIRTDLGIKGARNAYTITAPLVTAGPARAIDTVLDLGFPAGIRIDPSRLSARLSSEIQWNGASYTVSGSTDADGKFLIQGNHGLRVLVSQSAGSYSAEATAEDLPLPFDSELGVVNASFTLLGGYKAPGDWHLDFSRLALRPAGGKESRIPTILAKARLRPGSIALSDLSLGSGATALVGKADILYPTGSEGSASLKGSLSASGESWDFDVSVARGNLAGKAEVRGFQMSRIPGVAVDGLVDGFIDLRGPVDLSSILGKNSGSASGQGQTALKGQMMAGYRSKAFSVAEQRFDLDFNGSRLAMQRASKDGLSANASLDLGSGDFGLSLALSGLRPVDMIAAEAPPAWLTDFLRTAYTGSIRLGVPGLEGRRAEYAVDIGSEGEGEGAGGASPVGAASGSAVGGAGVSGESNRVTGLRVKGEGRGQAVKIEEARLEYGVVSGSFAGEVGLEGLTVDGLLGLELKGKGGEKGGQTELAVKGGKGEYRLAGATLRVGDEEYAQPEIEAKVGSKVVELKGGLGRGKEGKGREVSVQVRLDRTGELRAEGEVDLEGYRLGSVGVVYGAVTGKTEDLRVLRGLRATGRVYATSDFRKVSWNAPGMKVSGGEGFSLGCAGVGNGDYAEVKNVKIEAGGKEVEGEGRVDFEAGGDLRFRVKAKYEGIEYGIEGKAKADGSVEAKGDYGIEVEVQREAGGGYAVGFGVGGVPVPMGKGMGVVNVMARGKGEYRSGKEWRVEGVEFSVAGAGGKESPIPKIRGSLKGKAGEVELAEVVVEGWGRKLKGPVSIRYGEEVKGGVEVKGRLEREGGEGERGRWGQESWSVDAGYRDGSLKGSIDLKGFPIERLFGGGLSGESRASASPTIPDNTATPAVSTAAGTALSAAADENSLQATAGNLINDLSATMKAQNPDSPGTGIRGELDMTASFDGAFDLAAPGLSGLPLAVFSGKLANGEYNSVPLSLSFTGNLDKGVFNVTKLDASYINHEITGASVSLDPASGALDFAIPYTGVFGSDRLQTVIKGSGTSGAPSGSSFSSIVDSYNLKLDVQSLTFRRIDISEWRINVVSQSGRISVDSEGDEVSGRYEKDGNFELNLSRPVPVVAKIKGTFREGVIAAAVSGFELNFADLGPDVTEGLLRIEKGKASGSFTVAGPLDDPDLNGNLNLKDVVVRLQGYLEEPIGPFSVPLVLEGKNLYFSAPKVSIGNGAAELSLQVSLDHWNLASLSGKLNTKGNATVGVSGKIAGILIEKGVAHVNLNAELKGELLELVGTMNLESGDVVVNPGLFMGQGEAQAPQDGIKVYLDAQFGFGRRVQVFLPSKDLPLITGSADPSSALKLKFDQESGDFKLDGILVLRSGYAFYYLRNFFLKSGQVEFAESNAYFDPRISLSAELREVDTKGPVTITLSADRSPLSNLNPRLSSDPTMTEAQLVSLLGGGVLSTGSSGEVGLREAFIGSSEFLPQLNVVKAFEWRVREALGLDVFYLRSSFFQRWLYDISQPVVVGSSGNSLGSYLDNTYLYAGKFLGKSAFLHAALRLKEDPLVTSTNLRLDSEFGVEFETPFGLLRWNVSPSLSDSLFISDQSLSLSWKISF